MLGTKIKSTSDLNRFSFLEGNRRIVKPHLNRLIRAIEQENLLAYNPILVTRNHEVIDGQHRLVAARKLNLPIYYIEMETLEGNEIGTMNTIRKGWSVKDYVNYYSAQGQDSYKWLKEVMEGTDVYVSALIELAGSAYAQIKDGTFRIDLSGRKIFMERLERLEQYIAVDDNLKNARAMRAFIRLMQRGEFDHERMLDKLDQCSGKIEIYAHNIDMMREFERIYNWKEGTKIRIF
jgi:hypothetical protein